MSRKIISFSLPAKEETKLRNLLVQNHLSRSQFLRQLLDSYSSLTNEDNKDSDIAQLLRAYWEIKSSAQLQVKVVGLGIIHDDNGRILIVARQPDELVEQLTWSFPGGEMATLDFANELQSKCFDRTGQTVTVRNLVSARIFPDSSLKQTQIIALYFDCLSGDKKIKLNDHYTDYKWVKPMDVFKYFTTSTSDEVTKFLATIQYSSN